MTVRVPLAAAIAIGACSPAADKAQTQAWARECGLADLKTFVSSEDAQLIVVSEPRMTGEPWSDPSGAEATAISRQSQVEPVVRCMEPKAKAAGLKIDYPVQVAY